ncbi:hypothetical protein CBR_g70174 [Chara braunii]|uniref:J domain-containing protein n=1 Tax=Chara braunii TaxID=69332 RepID=A0A388MG27_CHABU|nr:hypothetical protein CBR_g70174 [Chara braunii]|eukprot:GBG93439.1 hypothetical protein CBR_g70174 [Chara braunii]
MRKLIGNSLKLPDSQLRSRLSELVLDSSGRVRTCPGGCPASQCLRRLSAAAITEREGASLGCCLLQNGHSPANSHPAGNTADNTNTCCIITGSPQCFLKVATPHLSPSPSPPPQFHQIASPPSFATSSSSSPISNGPLPHHQTLQTATFHCRRNLLNCGCRRLTTMMQSHQMMETPKVAMGVAANASASYPSQDEEDHQDSDDDGAAGATGPSSEENGSVHYQANGERRVDGEAGMAANGGTAAGEAAKGQMRSKEGTEGQDTRRREATRSTEGGPTSTTELDPSGTPSKCWECGHGRGPGTPANLFFCEECGSIQPVDPNVDYFDLLSVKKEFGVDEKELESKYKGLQKRLHPDLFATKSGTEKVHSAQQSANVIKAYYTLKRPLSRAVYMVQLQSPDVGHDMEDGTIQDQSLLMEVMEFRERIEDAAGDAETLKRLADENSEKMAFNMESVANALDAKEYGWAKKLIQRWTYYNRIAEEIEQQL